MHKIIPTIKTVFLATVLSFGLSFAYAWTAPTQNPPAGNVSAPINTSSVLQQKAGDFTVRNFVADTITIGSFINTNAITSPKFCIDGNCITAWPSVGGGVGSGVLGASCTTEGSFAYDNTSTSHSPIYCNSTLIWALFEPESCKTLFCGAITSASPIVVLPSGTNYIAFTARGGDGYNSMGAAGGGGSAVLITPGGGTQQLLMVSGGGGGSGSSKGAGNGGGAGGVNGAGGGAGWNGIAGTNYTGGGGQGGNQPEGCVSGANAGGAAGGDGTTGAGGNGGKGNLSGLFAGGVAGSAGGGGGGWGGGGGGEADTGCNGGDDQDGGGGGGGGYRNPSVSTVAVPGLSSLGLPYTVTANIAASHYSTVRLLLGAGTGAYVYAVYGHR